MSSLFVRRLALGFVLIGLAIAAAFLFPLDGVAHGGSLRLFGRLHPLLVHFPLGLLLLVPVLEIAGRYRSALREAAGFVLGLAFVGSFAAAFAGIALARADGHDGALVSNHLWGGIAVAVGAALAWALRPVSYATYGVVLSGTLCTLGWAAHQGGSLTHGAYYLTESLPAPVKRLLRVREAPTPDTYAAGTVFAAAVLPIFERHCMACHGAEKQKGDYRMDSFAALLAGGKSGKLAVVAGEVSQSELIRRMTLEITDDKIMPPRKRPRPTGREVALLRWWIKEGASRDLAVADVRDAPKDVTALLADSVLDASGEPVYVPRVGDYSHLSKEIAALETELGVTLAPVSRLPGDGLILRTRAVASQFGDAELARLANLAPYVVEAELAGTQLSDSGLVAIKIYSQLRRLHLERTGIRGDSLGELAGLEKLTYLNLCDTKVDDERLRKLTQMKTLRQLYLFGSEVTSVGVQSLRASLPDCQIGAIAVAGGDPVE
jgi:hypothetical protein